MSYVSMSMSGLLLEAEAYISDTPTSAVVLRGYSNCYPMLDVHLTVHEARDLAAALIRAAEHYDAETVRLAQQVAA